MRQRTVMELFDKMEIQEPNNEIKEVIEDKVLPENENISDIKEVTTDSNGIVEVIYGNEIYRTWTVKFIRPFVIKYSKIIHSESLIIREFNSIDLTILNKKSDEITPVEIQKTSISNDKFNHSEFENSIRKQLEDNIENYGKCWLFMDSEYLRYLQYDSFKKNISINMTWLIKLMKEDTLKVFAIKYDGTVKELTTKDFDFLKDISQTCPLGYESDERILNRNKLKILRNVIHGYNFTQEEIDNFYNEFDVCVTNRKLDTTVYFMKSDNKRCKLYGHMINSTRQLLNINNIMFCNMVENKHTNNAVTLGLFHQNDFHGKNNLAQIQFVDKFNVAQYFPGYLRNKEMWDYCKRKQRSFSMNEFRGIITGTFNYEFIKKQSTMEDYD